MFQKTTSKQSEHAENHTEHVDHPRATDDYRSPQMFDLGDAVELVRRGCVGHMRDGTGGWYYWCPY